MGERLGGDGVMGRRRVRPRADVSGPWDEAETAALETALATAIRTGDRGPGPERRAVAAYRDALGAGAHRARTRRRDDWRPARRHAGRPVKLTFGVVFASLALGGAAVAAIGSAGSSADTPGSGRSSAQPSSAATGGPGGGASPASSGGPGTADRPAPAQDTEAHCRAYEQIQDHGRALDATTWQQLVAAAGGKDKVAAYCSEQLAGAKHTPGGPSATGKPGSSTSGGGSGGAAGTPGNGNGRTSDGKGNGKNP